MDIEKIKNITNEISNPVCRKLFEEFVGTYEEQKASIKPERLHHELKTDMEHLKNETGYNIKLSVVKTDLTTNSRDGDGAFSHTVKEIIFHLPLDSQKLQDAYDKLPDDEKAPANYDISVDDKHCMEALLHALDKLVLNLKQFTDREDNYYEIARTFNTVKSKIASLRNGI